MSKSRMFWLFVVLGCFSIFLYITISQLLFLLTWPKAVNVDIIYADKLDFPAVTVCNQNFFRGSKTFELGLYDQVDDRFRMDRAVSTDGSCVEGTFDIHDGIFTSEEHSYPRPIHENPSYFATYEQITILVCKHLCLVYHDATCNAFAYQRSAKRCSITSLTPIVISSGDFPDYYAQVYVHTDKTVDTYVRKRCYGLTRRTCDFDSGMCEFYTEAKYTSRWVRQSGPTSTPDTGPDHDHTQVIGSYMYVEPVVRRHSVMDYTRMLTPFVHTLTPVCLLLAYSMVGKLNDLGQLRVLRRSALGTEALIWLTNNYQKQGDDEWNMALVHLGIGQFQVIIQADAGSGLYGDVAVDDISIGPCTEFVEECRRTLKGSTYIGTQSVARNGQACEAWNETRDEHWQFAMSSLPFLKGSYCRNPGGRIVVDDPWCYVLDGTSFSQQPCNVPFCACENEEFRCGNGMCVNKLLTCDGRNNCGDNTDETIGCTISANCSFEKGNSCGYNLDSSGLILRGKSSWLRYRGQIRNGNLREDNTLKSTLGHFMYLDSGTVTLSYRERVPLTIPIQPPSEMPQCLKFYVYNKRDVIYPDAMGGIRVFYTIGRYLRRPLAWIGGSTSRDWYNNLITIPRSSVPFYITIEAAIGYSYYSDMAIDDVTLTDGACFTKLTCAQGYFYCSEVCISRSLTCDGKIDCWDHSDEDPDLCKITGPDRYTCNFTMTFMCGYTDDSNPDYNGWDQTDGLVQVKDLALSKDGVKRLVSQRWALEKQSCLSFKYTANRHLSYCIISVYQEFVDSRLLSYMVGGSLLGHPPVWRNAHVNLIPTPDMALTFEANCSTFTDKIEMALTNISLTLESCEEKLTSGSFTCNFLNDDDCGYLDVSRDGPTWFPDPDAQGMTTEVPNNANIDVATMTLLFPKLTVDNDTVACARVTLEIVTPAYMEVILYKYKEPRETFHEIEIYRYPQFITMKIDFGPGSYFLALTVKIRRGGRLRVFSVDSTLYTCLTPKLSDLPHIRQPNVIIPPGAREDESGEMQPREPFPRPIPLPSTDQPTTTQEPVIIESLKTYYTRAGHQATDLLHRCDWAGKPCSVSNFSSRVTDFGFCHTFNPGTEGYPVVQTASTGSSAGLKLMLNIEQYDYMRGPHHDAGVKIFLSPYEEVAQVRDLGFSIGPGDHAFVAVKLTQTASLPAPWGMCEVQTLKYGGNYTYSACIRECETKALVKSCGCRDAYMPSNSQDDPPICNITSFLGCAVASTEHFGQASQKCKCTEPCQRDVYETQVSYSALSRLSVNQILTSGLEQLNQTHRHILEVNQRADPTIISHDLKLFNEIQIHYAELMRFAFREVWHDRQSFAIRVEEALQYFLQGTLTSDLERSVLGNVDTYMLAFDEHYGPVHRTIQSLAEQLLMNIEVLNRLYDNYITTQTGDVPKQAQLVQDTQSALVTAINAYQQAFHTRKSVYANGVSTYASKQFLPEKMNKNEDECNMVVNMLVTNNPTSNVLNQIQSSFMLPQTTTGNASAAAVKSRMDASLYFTNLLATYNPLTDMLTKSRTCMDEYLSFLQSLDTFKQAFVQTRSHLSSQLKLSYGTATVNDYLDYVDETEKLEEYKEIVLKLSNGFNIGNVSKQDMVNTFRDENLATVLRDVNMFISRIKLRLVEPTREKIDRVKAVIVNTYSELLRQELNFSEYFQESYDDNQLRSLDLWKRPKANYEDTFRYQDNAADAFQLGNIERFTKIYATKVLNELADWYTRPLEDAINKFESGLLKRQSHLVSAVENMKSQTDLFLQQTQLGPEFIKENFLAVDVFFAQLKYERTEQIKAYNVEVFFGDVGGFMGLLLGGSLVSLVEFIDLIIYNCARQVRQRNRSDSEVGEEQAEAAA